MEPGLLPANLQINVHKAEVLETSVEVRSGAMSFPSVNRPRLLKQGQRTLG